MKNLFEFISKKLKLPLLLLLIFLCSKSIAQNVGIGTISPQSKLDVSGDVAFHATDITISSTSVNNLDVTTTKQYSYNILSSSPGLGNFIITGITAGTDGRMIMLNNKSGFSFDLYNENTATAAANRIVTGIGTFVTIYAGGNVVLQYAATEQRWFVKSTHNSSLDNIGNTAFPSTGIVLSETKQNALLQAAGFEFIGITSLSVSELNPDAYTWFYPPSPTNAYALVGEQTAVWTGNKIILWGGYLPDDNTYSKIGKIYDPEADTWVTLPLSPLTERSFHTAQWTGTEMLIWGGENTDNDFNDGARYNLQTNQWTSISLTNAPTSRKDFTSVWTGTEMIVFGGRLVNTNYRTDYKKYNPATNTWSNISLTNAPSPRILHTAVWTGSKMIVFGGKLVDGTNTNTGGIYDPTNNTWTSLPTAGAPPNGLSEHTAVWTGTKMIVFGGRNNLGTLENNFYLYDVASNTWSLGNNTNKPPARTKHTAVWTGEKMIIFGGTPTYNNGGIYDPNTNAWGVNTIPAAPGSFISHTSTWTGNQMVVVGYDPPQTLKKGLTNPQNKLYYLYKKN